jgi:DNA polymerase III alpha subunit
MISDQFGQLVFNDTDIFNLAMQGKNVAELKNVLVDESVNIKQLSLLLDQSLDFVSYQPSALSQQEFDRQCQSQWHMPQEYKDLDIAQHILNLCKTQAELQRCGEELLLFQEHNLFNLLRYLKYLVDTFNQNSIIWGVGRGSSVASYVLYLLGVHRVDSLYYNLDINEFLR